MILIPQPHSIRQTGGAFPLGNQTRIECADLFTSDAFQVASHLRDRLCETHGIALEFDGSNRAGKGSILLGTFDDPVVVRALKAAGLRVDPATLGSEGYALSITRDRVVMAARAAAGLFYAAQTFLQMIEGGGEKLRVPCARCVDRPLHPFRGVHLYIPPKQEIEYFKRLIRYMASCKINTVILEIGAGMEFRRHPEINRVWETLTDKARKFPFSQMALINYNTLHTRGKDSFHPEIGGGTWLSHEDLRGILRCAREHHVEIIPEVQSPGHAFWLCMAYPEIAEWKDDKYPDTLCPSNPRSYELLFDVMEEVIEVFEPKWIHSGNDEYYFYGICPKCRKRTGHDILAGHLNKVNDFLRARGVRHMVWADKLINCEETRNKRSKEWGTGRMIKWGGGERLFEDPKGSYLQKATWKAIDRVPDDLVMLDWYAFMAPDTEKYFAKHGKQVLFGNFSPFSFAKYPHRLYAPNVRGGEASTWTENGQMAHAHQNWALVVAITADMLWSEVYRKTHLHRRMDLFREFWTQNRNALNCLEDRLPSRRPGKVRFQPLRLGDGRVAKQGVLRGSSPVPFRIAAQPVVLRPEDIKGHTIPIGRKVRSVVLLYASPVDPAAVNLPPMYEFSNYHEYYLSREIGALKVRTDFALQTQRHPVREGRVPLRLGFEIGSPEEPYGLAAISRPTFCDGVRLADGRLLYAYEWVNPNPENMAILDVTLGRGRAAIPSDILLYAVTLIL